jgi:hypothetical protein
LAIAVPNNHLALWAGLTALFTNLAAINLVVLLADEKDPKVTVLASLVSAVAVAASVFAKQKRDDLKEERERHDRRKDDGP